MKFCWSTITVNDMEASLKFYQDIIGLPLNQRFIARPGVEIAFLGEGETKVELICELNHKVSGVIEGISIGFVVQNLDEMIKFVKGQSIAVESGPFQPNPHTRFFYVKDPNGLSIQFVENL